MKLRADRNLSRIGALLREWRQRRRLSQLDLALAAGTSARHLSYVETGRSAPSRDMVLRLSHTLDVPLRERNTLLVAAGYAPAYQESSLDDDHLASARAALEHMLAAHEPYPAVAVDRWWNVVTANTALTVLTDGVPARLLADRPNVYRLVLHPEGLAARLANPRQVREQLLERLARQADTTGDPRLRELHEEVSEYPAVDTGAEEAGPTDPGPFQVPIRVRTPHGELSLFGTMATFGAPADVTLSELAVELFYPLDEFTARFLRGRADALSAAVPG
ncbi:helix-turn-helix domain-containing protein [Nocardia jinanensis]|uniref:Transcriptional regulator n=1 Tax=Nocardia jinanensis TaxID=382504 RepID=A0A917RFT1_9NOCA|nr:helix-turn-helix transcriptional regulator [Nocardia jinanensis]GGL06046.1 transcriptional regulator [Nocardia jinanensis]